MTSKDGTIITGANSDTKDLADQFKRFHGAEIIDAMGVDSAAEIPLLVIPDGKRVESAKRFVDEYRTAPERRTGTAKIATLDSFVAHVNRMKDTDTVLFASPDRARPAVTAVYDYHQAVQGVHGRTAEAALPRFGQHRAVYDARLSDEWKAWVAVDGRSMAQAEFASFLEDRIGDVIVPPADMDDALRTLVDTLGGRLGGPAALLALSRGLAINVETAVRQAVTLETGEIAIVYEESHKDGTGAPVKTPNLFLIALPVFYAGAPYRVAVRLRYRVQGGRITWSVHLVQPDKTFDHAFEEVCREAEQETGLPLFVGTPEA